MQFLCSHAEILQSCGGQLFNSRWTLAEVIRNNYKRLKLLHVNEDISCRKRTNHSPAKPSKVARSSFFKIAAALSRARCLATDSSVADSLIGHWRDPRTWPAVSRNTSSSLPVYQYQPSRWPSGYKVNLVSRSKSSTSPAEVKPLTPSAPRSAATAALASMPP